MRSEAGEIAVPIEIDGTLMRGVVAPSLGWGRQRTSGRIPVDVEAL